MANFKISKITLVLLVAAIIIGAGALHYIKKMQPNVPDYLDNSPYVPPATTTPPAQTPPPAATTKPGTTPPPPPATGQPGSLNLPIPFTSQAPTANWDELHNEACEEASAIMANAYLTGDKDVVIPAADVEAQISSLTSWQDKNFGYHLDTTAAETVKMIHDYYGLNATIKENYSLQDIKDALNSHSVVILPVNGQIIGNPNYTQPGPIYHMLVVRGYTSTGLITNDSGTRRGQNYPYSFNTLYNAAADWNHSSNTITTAKKIMIVVSK